MSKRSRTQVEEITIFPRLIAGMVLIAPFTVLALQGLRFEIFETEKAGLLVLIGAVLLGCWIANRLHNRRIPSDWRQHLKNPLVAAAFFLLVILLLSTVFSLNPRRSLIGSPQRAQGLLITLVALLLFISACKYPQRIRQALLPALLVILIPVSALTIIHEFDLDPALDPLGRAGSTTGQPNFLSSWLVMVLFYGGIQTLWTVRQWPRPLAQKQKLTLLLLSGFGLLLVASILIVRSRGAILGLGAGILLAVFIHLARRRRARLTAGLLVGLIVLIAAYTITSRALAATGNASESGLLRLFVPSDPVRIQLWEGTLNVLKQQAIPLTGADGTPDPFASFRPWIGYGPETTDYLQVRYMDTLREHLALTIFIDRAHNLMFDALLSYGWPGLIAWLAIYEAAFYLALRRLGIIPAGRWWGWLLAQVAGIPVGVLLVAGVMQVNWPIILPVGAAGGMILGIIGWIAGQAFRPAGPLPPLTRREMIALAVFGVVVIHWIDNQFGFIHLAAQPLWWIMLGILAGSEQEESGETTAISLPADWLAGTLLAGIFFIHSLGVPFKSNFLSQQMLTLMSVITILLLILAAGIGGYLTTSEKGLTRRSLIIVLGGWLLLYGIKLVLVRVAAAILVAPERLALADFRLAFRLPGWSGVVAVVLAIAGWLLLQPEKVARRSFSWPVLIILAGLIAGSIFYLRGFAASTLVKAGNSLIVTGDPLAYPLAAEVLGAARSQAPYDEGVRFQQLYLLLGLTTTAPDQETSLRYREILENDIADLHRLDPCVIYTKPWLLFEPQYRMFFGSIPGTPF